MVNPHDIIYVNNDHSNVSYLADRFMVVQPDSRPENWSDGAVDFDDGASEFSTVSSVR